MADAQDFTLKVRRFDPESGEPGLLARLRRGARPRALGARRHPPDPRPRGRLAGHPLLLPRGHLRLLRRAHQRQVRAGLQHPHLRRRRRRAPNGAITVEPMGNMPVIKDLIVDMDAVHWKKIQRVVPWLLPEGDPPESASTRSPAEADDRRHPVDGLHPVRRVRLGLPVAGGRPRVHRPGGAGQGLPLRRRPARRPHRGAPAGPGRGPARHLRLHPLLRLHRGLPEGRGADVQIMRLRRRATGDYGIKDSNNGYGHEKGFVDIIEKWGTLHEAQLLPRSFGQGSHGPRPGRARGRQAAAA